MIRRASLLRLLLGWLLLSPPLHADTRELSLSQEYLLKPDQFFFTPTPGDPLLTVPDPAQRQTRERPGRHDSHYWVAFSLSNRSPETHWVLDPGNLIAEHLVLHVQTGDRHQIIEQGFPARWPFDLRYGIPLELPTGPISRLWLSVEAPAGAVNPIFSILPASQYPAKSFGYQSQIMLAVGALAILGLHPLFLFLLTGDRASACLALLLVASALAWAAQSRLLAYGTGLGPQPALLYLPLFIACTAALGFARLHLLLHRPQPLTLLLDGTALLALGAGLAGLLLPTPLYLLLLKSALTLSLILLASAGLWRATTGTVPTRFFIAGAGLLLLGGFFHALDQVLRLGLVENDLLLATRIQVLAAIAFLLALIERNGLRQRARPLPESRAPGPATDPLTRLPDRSAFERDVRAWEAYCKEGILSDFYLTFFEVASLQQINRERGMREGDRLLILVSQWLRQQTSPRNLYRTSGDEFVVLTQQPVPWELAPLYLRLSQEGFPQVNINLGCSCLSEASGRSSLLKLADERLHARHHP